MDMLKAALTSPVPRASRRSHPRFQRLRVIGALMVREMQARFGRSAGGYVWALAEPLGGILLLAIAFSLALRAPPLGSSFMLFYATGIIPMAVYNGVQRGVAKAADSNRGLLNYPVVALIDAVIAKFLLTSLTLGVVAAILFTGIIVVDDLYVILDPARLAAGFGLAALVGLGVGSVNCVLIGFFPTWKNIWTVLSRPIFILSGVFFLFESVPAAFQRILWWNPLAHVIATMRSGIYATYEPAFVSYAYVLGVALGLFAVGGWLLRRHAAWLIEQ